MSTGVVGTEANAAGACREHVRYAVDQGIATITLDRPESRNALSIVANARLHDLWSEVDHDASVRVIVLTSADCGVFCAGMDLKEAARIKAERGLDILDVLPDPFYERMRKVEKPIVAAMTGHFTAGGMVLALNSDLRVGLAGTRGGITEARIGRGSPWAVPMLGMLPQALVMEMVLTGDLVPIERLRALGFISSVEATPDAVRRRAYEIAERIRDNAPLTVRASKASILAGMSLGCDAGFAHAKEIFKPVYASEDAQEGPRAFAEKRNPVWKGR